MSVLYVTIWIASWLFAAGEVGRARRPNAIGWGWHASAAGLILALIHTALAFDIVHGWRHDAAVLHTAAQTQAVFGQAVGWGIYVNYLFFAVWTLDLASWRASGGVAGRSRTAVLAVRAFYAVIFLNGVVIFAAPARRPLGIALMLVLAAAWTRRP